MHRRQACDGHEGLIAARLPCGAQIADGELYGTEPCAWVTPGNLVWLTAAGCGLDLVEFLLEAVRGSGPVSGGRHDAVEHGPAHVLPCLVLHKCLESSRVHGSAHLQRPALCSASNNDDRGLHGPPLWSHSPLKPQRA